MPESIDLTYFSGVSDKMHPRDAIADPFNDLGLPDWFVSMMEAEKENGRTLYAILDGASDPTLVARIEAGGIPASCLFSGEAAEDLTDVAPWLVALDPQGDLARDMLSSSGDAPMPWELWDRGGWLLIFSREDLGAVRKRLRRLTRCQDASGRWYFVRFWERGFLNMVAENHGDPAYRNLLQGDTLIWRDPRPEAPNRLRRLEPHEVVHEP